MSKEATQNIYNFTYDISSKGVCGIVVGGGYPRILVINMNLISSLNINGAQEDVPRAAREASSRTC